MLPGDTESPCDAVSPYRHPLQGSVLADGTVPSLDVQDSPSGKRYAIGDTRTITADGVVQHHSGLFELDQAAFTAEDYYEWTGIDLDGVPPPPAVVAPKIGPELAKIVDDVFAGVATADPVVVGVSVLRPPTETLTQQLEREVAQGSIQTVLDYREVRAQVMQQRKTAVSTQLAAAAAEIEAVGATVLWQCQTGHCLTILAEPTLIPQLAASPHIRRMDLAATSAAGDSHPDGAQTTANAIDTLILEEIHQVSQFYAFGYTGQNIPNTPLQFGFADQWPPYTGHWGFRNSAWPSSATRIAGTYDCNSAQFLSCQDEPGGFPSGFNDHGTMSVGIVFADYNDGQDWQLATYEDQRRRSGLAPEAWGNIYSGQAAGGNDAISLSFQMAWDHANSETTIPNNIFTDSQSFNIDVQCLGEDNHSRAANELTYESGMLSVQSAGNQGSIGSGTDCSVRSPGSAIGVFTVGSHGWQDDDPQFTDEFCDTRAAPIDPDSSWGGSITNYAEGKKRSIIDITAYDNQEYRSCQNGGSNCYHENTSAASPTIAGSTLAFIDMYKHEFSDFIDSPGVLFANLLLMGDRATEFGGNQLSQFSHRLGAGRARMRMLNAAGLDEPSFYADLAACVDHGQTLTFITFPAFGPGLDVIKVVIWWYDRRHEDGTPVDNIDLFLRNAADNSLLRRSNNPHDNKEMVYYANRGLAGDQVKVEIVETNVTSDIEGCGVNSMKVYLAMLAEDSARNDPDGPTWDAVSCEGVEPI